jgi:hypothetical protein
MELPAGDNPVDVSDLDHCRYILKLDSLTGNYVLAGRKIILFGRYVHYLYVGIVQ